MKLGRLYEEGAAEEPNITPLIDIVFILLIFFVVTTTFSKDLGLEVTRPEASTGSAMPSRLVRVAVNAQGDLAVDGRATRLSRIEPELKERLDLNTERQVLVIADGRVDANLLVRLIDAARSAGATSVSLGVEGAL